MSEPVDREDVLLLAPGPLRAALAKLLRCADASVLIELAEHVEELRDMSAEHGGRDHYLQETFRGRDGKIRGLRPLMSLPGRRRA